MSFAGSVEDVADESAGEYSIFCFCDCADRSGETEALCQDLGELDGGCGDEPDLVAGGDVHVGELFGAGPHFVGHALVDDFFAEVN